jgi:catechol 2,3-dioxygenase
MKKTFGLPDETRLCQVHLRTRNSEPVIRFYTSVLGLTLVRQEGAATALGAQGQAFPMLVFSEDRAAMPHARRSTGLYHIAIRFPSRCELARALRRLADNQYPIEGAADHLFSESLYLSDPDGNGLELYTDRPRSQWPLKNGLLAGATKPLDIQNLRAESGSVDPPTEAPPGTDIGHIHLHVAGLAEAERFYHEYFGLDVTIRELPGALFFAAGGYHHHIGVNTWAGSASPAANSVGLVSYRFSVPMPEVLYCLRQRAPFAGFETQTTQSETGSEVLRIRDPNGSWMELVQG